jgi:hypothetical protein
MLVTRELTDLEGDVWDDPVDLVLRIVVSHRRTGVLEDALTSAVRAPAEMWTSRIAESIGDGAADAVVVALDMSTPQGRSRKKVVSVGINDEGTTPTPSRLNVLAFFLFFAARPYLPYFCCFLFLKGSGSTIYINES